MRIILRLLPVLVLAIAGWLAMPFFQSAETQVRRSHDELFDLAGGRYWAEVGGMLSNEYEDEWGNNAEDAIEIARELLRGFLVLDLQWTTTEVVVTEDENGLSATVTGDARIEGNGAGLSQMVMSKVNNLQEPWTFTWQKEGWKPGDWRLVEVTHPKLKGMSPSSF
ncbi:hypothetical protein FEM03_16180 [Phragmitibacter flavus]|uniref:Nuclear transport factor 2 family protein n=1 Tax=Phragmitibacter flavus TaxID=2576071 RepID=A0A5R8KC34_9BACT|nr:hypothetical protein [Phragmitibacter flavus]TLD69856.1 hypothetical protein FEM03_16180 [Phragmitibacter flavus]